MGGAVFFSLRGGDPFLRWAGGKRKLADQILAKLKLPSPNSWTSDFMQRPTFHLSDANVDLVAAYVAVRDSVDDLVVLLRQLPQDTATFQDIRSMTLMTPLMRGVRAIWLNLHCHSGLWRVNSRGQFNVPPQPDRFVSVKMDRVAVALRAASEQLQGVEVEHEDFTSVLAECGEGDFIYCDPPYMPDDSSQFVGYVAGGFGKDEDGRDRHLQLAVCARDAALRGARLVISNSGAAAPLYRKVFDGVVDYDVEVLSVQRAIGVGKGDQVKRRQEEILVAVSNHV